MNGNASMDGKRARAPRVTGAIRTGFPANRNSSESILELGSKGLTLSYLQHMVMGDLDKHVGWQAQLLQLSSISDSQIARIPGLLKGLGESQGISGSVDAAVKSAKRNLETAEELLLTAETLRKYCSLLTEQSGKARRTNPELSANLLRLKAHALALQYLLSEKWENAPAFSQHKPQMDGTEYALRSIVKTLNDLSKLEGNEDFRKWDFARVVDNLIADDSSLLQLRPYVKKHEPALLERATQLTTTSVPVVLGHGLRERETENTIRLMGDLFLCQVETASIHMPLLLGEGKNEQANRLALLSTWLLEKQYGALKYLRNPLGVNDPKDEFSSRGLSFQHGIVVPSTEQEIARAFINVVGKVSPIQGLQT